MPNFGTCFGKRRTIGILRNEIPRVLAGSRSALIIFVHAWQMDRWLVWCLGALVVCVRRYLRWTGLRPGEEWEDYGKAEVR